MSKKGFPRLGSLATSLDASVIEQLRVMRERLVGESANQEQNPPKPVVSVSDLRSDSTQKKDRKKSAQMEKTVKKPTKRPATLVKVEGDGKVDIYLKVTDKTDLQCSALNQKAHLRGKVLKDREILSRAGKGRVERATSFSLRHTQSPLTEGLTAGIVLSMELHKANLVTGSEGLLVLKAHRGSMLKSAAYCSVCHSSTAPLYRYADSNYGPVILCSVCKTQAFERSFGYADAMPLAVDHAHAHKGKW
ncbi:hypothetical protein [Aeromonas caviae]|uniref:hypothetical protein n=1 Tax=Aeromonas caviae TaxID=648 RepID=UPI00191FC112|nr:hypothetical protein [Aeromonas caviae]MBL0651699.1 hypothetical protein [Aeromonas caviae]